MTTLNNKMAKGAAWMVLLRLSIRGIGFISTIVLARLLLPGDFGLVAMAMSVIAIIELLQAFGFDTALIQKQDPDRTHYDTAWTFNILVGLAAGALIAAMAELTARFYGEPRLTPVMYVLALSTVVQGFENIGVVNFRKEMTFSKEFYFQLGKKAVSFVVAIPAAVLMRNYWALIIGILAGRIAGIPISYLMHPYRPRLSFVAQRELVAFSKWILANNIFVYLRDRASDFVIGRLSGPRALGLYSVSYEISNLPTTELVMPINRAVYPGYSKMMHDRSMLRQGFLNVISVIATFALPAGGGIAAVAPPLVGVLLGANWYDAIPLIPILAFYGVIIAMQTNSLYVYIALGEPRTATLVNTLYVIVLIPALIFGTSRAGPVGAAWACLFTALTTMPINLFVLLRRLELSAFRFLAAVWRPLTATAIMYLAVVWLVRMVGSAEALPVHGMVLSLLAAVGLGVIVYSGSLLLLWLLSDRPAGIERTLLGRIRRTSP